MRRRGHDAWVDFLTNSAVCECGWESTGHEDVDAALAAIQEHYHSIEGDAQ